MKIVQINSACGTGSTGKIALAISKRLSQEGIENYIFYSGNHKSSYELGIKINSKMDIRVHQILSRIFGDQGWHSSFQTKKLIRKIQEINPDVIHLHNLHGYYLNIKLLFDFLASSNIPVIWTLHDCWAFTGHCTHYTSCDCEKWKYECEKCPQYKMYPYSLFFDRSTDLFKRKKELYEKIKKMTVTVVSDWLRQQVACSALLKEKRVIHIANGIDLGKYTSKQPLKEICGHNIEEKAIILGVANNWAKRKGLSDFIELSKVLDEKYQIVLIGLSQSQIENLPSNIIGIQRTESQDVLISLYSSALVYFNPSVEETFGLTTLEAMACATPVIVYDATACPELVGPKCGYVVNIGDIGAVYDKIKEIDNVGKEYYMGGCLNKAKQYNQTDIYSEYLALYHEVATKNETACR